MTRPGHRFTLSLVQTPNDMDLVAQMRYRAYRSVHAVRETADARFTDVFDGQPEARTFLAWWGQTPLASTRTLCARGDLGALTSALAFQDVLKRWIPDDAVVVEANRFVVDPHHAELSNGVVWPLFRAHLLRCAVEGADFFVAGVRPEHVPVYRRLMHLEIVGDARVFPGLRTPMYLMMGDCRRDLERIFRKRPYLRCSPEETTLLFGEVSRVHPDHPHARPGL